MLNLDSLQDAIVVTDDKFVLVEFNSAAENMFRYSKRGAIGKSVYDFITYDRMEKGLVEAVARRSDGSEFCIEMTVSPCDGGFLYIIRDSTDSRKDGFLAVLSHELRNPLAPILSSLHISRMRDNDSDPVVRDHRVIIERQVQHMVRLLDELLDVSRINRGKIQIKKEPVAIQRVIAHAIEQAKPNIDMRYHSLQIDVPSFAIWVNGDECRLQQVFVNLLNNAAKYSEPCANLRIFCKNEGDVVKIGVADSGIGISEQMIAHIFDLFWQAEHRGQSSLPQGGLGVGLSLSKQLVNLHGGKIEAQSPGLNMGSTFTVTLPTISGKSENLTIQEHVTNQQKTLEVSSFPAFASQELRLLVVDDNIDVAESLVALLRMEGYDVWVANDGLAAIKIAGDFEPDVVLLDIALPYIDGYKVCREIKAMLPHTKLIAITGLAQEKDKQFAKSTGFDDYLVKPISPDVLNKMLEKHTNDRTTS